MKQFKTLHDLFDEYHSCPHCKKYFKFNVTTLVDDQDKIQRINIMSITKVEVKPLKLFNIKDGK